MKSDELNVVAGTEHSNFVTLSITILEIQVLDSVHLTLC